MKKYLYHSNRNKMDVDKYTRWISRSIKIHDECGECPYLPICGFGCANFSDQNNGDINKCGLQ